MKQLGEWRAGLLAAAGLLYFLGYMVWSVHAWRFGLGLLPLLQVQYFVAGFGPALLLGLLGVFLWLTSRLPTMTAAMRDQLDEVRSLGVRLYAIQLAVLSVVSVLILGLAALPFYLLLYIVESLRSVSIYSLWPFLSVFVVGSLIAFYVPFKNGIDTVKAQHDFGSASFTLGKHVAKLSFFLVMPIFFLSVSITLILLIAMMYILSFYPNWPQEAGGVRPRCAYMDLDPAKVSQETQAVLLPPGARPDGKSAVQSKRLDILFSGNDFWIAALPDEWQHNRQVYQLRKEAVQAIAWCGQGSAVPPPWWYPAVPEAPAGVADAAAATARTAGSARESHLAGARPR